MDAQEIERLVDREDQHWWYQERRFLISRFVRRFPPGLAVDIGAAGGGNARVLRALGWSVTAVELSEAGSVAARRRGITAVRADARALPFPDRCADLVLCCDVLEHIEDDQQAARELARVLRPGGTAFVSVPADPRLWSGHDVAVGHVRRYTRPAFESLLKASGFDVVRLWSWNVLLRPVVALHRRRSSGSDLAPVHPAMNVALRATVACERILPVGRLSGVSLFASVRPRPDDIFP